MAKYPQQIQQVGRLVDLGVIALTDVAQAVSTESMIVMAVSIQAEPANGVDVLVGDGNNQSRRLAARDVYTAQVGDAANVWMRADGIGGTASVNVHVVMPPGGR